MERVGIEAAQQDGVMQTIAAILHLGNVAFAPHPKV